MYNYLTKLDEIKDYVIYIYKRTLSHWFYGDFERNFPIKKSMDANTTIFDYQMRYMNRRICHVRIEVCQKEQVVILQKDGQRSIYSYKDNLSRMYEMLLSQNN